MPGITLAVERQPGANTVEIVQEIRRLLPELTRQIPPAVKVSLLLDRSESIQESVDDVKMTLLITVALVVLVIFLFLRNVPATIIPGLALPLSVVGTFGVMALGNYSLDNLSLMALTLAVGFVVDDAIVMLENIVRHQEMGKPPLMAALDGSREIGFTIVSMTLSLAAVFLPVLFMGGIVGRLFQEFAVVIMAAIVLSGIISLTLTPMLCSCFLRSHDGRHPQEGLYGWLERCFDSMARVYERSLSWALRHRLGMVWASVALLVATAALFVLMPKGFLPTEDTGMLAASTEAEEGISFDAMVERQRQLNAILERSPFVERYNSVVGIVASSQSMNSGNLMIKLAPSGARPPIDVVAAQLRRELNVLPDLKVFLRIPPSINIGGRASRALYQYTLMSADIPALYAAAARVESALRELPEIQDVNSDLQLTNPELYVDIDRERASRLGVSAAQIDLAMQSAYGSREISTIYTAVDDYKVYVELQKIFQKDSDSLSRVYVRSADGYLVPLQTLAALRQGTGPVAVNHSGQFPSVTISYNLRPGVALGEAVAAVEKAGAALLPDSVSARSQGTAQAFQDSMKGMGLLLLLAVAVIYLVLGVLYESFIHPLTILSGLPSAAFGALVTLWLAGADLNLYAFVGIIMLVGIVKKNAIMMLDFALEAQRHDPELSPLEAITRGCHVRFRPIMMTTMAALMGALPIAVGMGAGASARRPLGLAVVGGLCFSQLITLYLTPVYYYYLERLSRWCMHRWGGRLGRENH